MVRKDTFIFQSNGTLIDKSVPISVKQCTLSVANFDKLDCCTVALLNNSRLICVIITALDVCLLPQSFLPAYSPRRSSSRTMPPTPTVPPFVAI